MANNIPITFNEYLHVSGTHVGWQRTSCSNGNACTAQPGHLFFVLLGDPGGRLTDHLFCLLVFPVPFTTPPPWQIVNPPLSVNGENVKFGSCSMESDKYITVCENVGGVQQIAIVDMTFG